jgi:hypothetical protein
MWLAAIRLVVPGGTAAGVGGATLAAIERDGAEVARLLVERPAGRRAATFDYRLADVVPDSPSVPGPDHGLEVSGWLRGHLSVRLLDDAAGTSDGITMFVQLVRRRFDPSGTMGWVDSAQWHFLGALGIDVPVSHGRAPAGRAATSLPVLTAVG